MPAFRGVDVITILIVEDEPAIRELLAIQLKSADYKVVLAPDAIQARARLLEGAPDLFLLDWMLPGESGLDLARSIRRDASLRNVPIIMITARKKVIAFWDSMPGSTITLPNPSQPAK
jgi:two-component system, OmpR family, phosphate regulon response regulator PhoB